MRLPIRKADGHATLELLGETDTPWIASLVDDTVAAIGQPWRVVLDRVRLRPPRTHQARAAAIVMALRRTLGRVRPPIAPRLIRNLVLGPPALDAAARSARVRAAAATLALPAAELLPLLWSDLPGERLVVMPRGRPRELELCAFANLTLVQRTLARAHAVQLKLIGNPRPIVRIAAREGLIFSASRRADGATIIDLSGPLSVVHRTTVYGRALGRLVPYLAACDHFELLARCELESGTAAVVRVTSPIHLPPRPPPRPFAGTVEARFVRELGRAATDWTVLREPDAIESHEHLLFADFVLEHRHDPARRWHVEIVGFWTLEYLATKLARYRAAGIANVVFCIELDHAIADLELPAGAHILRYHRRIELDAILAIIE